MTEMGPLSSIHRLGSKTVVEIMVKSYAHAASKLVPWEFCPRPCASYDKLLAGWPKSWGAALDHAVFHACQKVFPEVFV